MSADAELYRHYAAECLEFAKTTRRDDLRQGFLIMAQTWTEAANRIDGLSALRPVLNKLDAA
jgi:hypothetical protein